MAAFQSMAQYLGTEIASVQLEEGEEPLFVSDLHLRPSEHEKIAAFQTLLASRPPGSKVFILGDLFDFWVGAPQGRARGWRDLLGILRKEGERGLKILVLHGNRDFQLGRAFERKTGAKVWRGGLLLTGLGRCPLLCLHGDELCLDDTRYQRAKTRLRSWPVRSLLRILPFALSRRLADTARAQSQKVLGRTPALTMLPTEAALQALRNQPTLFPCNLLFGHIHQASRGALPGEGKKTQYFILPAFEAGDEGHALLRKKELVLILKGKEDPLFGTPLTLPRGKS